MSKAEPPIPENIKVALLRETNYRCGYCMMNITPAAYYTENRNSTEAKEVVPMYYQPYDCTHIEPYNEENPTTNSFYNLIALCKNCHWKTEPQHSNAIIPKEQLKALKLHWMIASGRFTRLEIDVLMDLYQCYITGVNHTLHLEQRSWDTVDGGKIDLFVQVLSTRQACLFKNIINKQFVIRTQVRESSLRNIPRGSVLLCDNDGTNPMPLDDSLAIFINNNGIDFCQNFHEAYQELDKIEI